MARRKNKHEPEKVQPTFSAPTIVHLEELVDLGYGGTPTAVAHYLITRGIDDLLRTGLIGPGVKRQIAKAKAKRR